MTETNEAAPTAWFTAPKACGSLEGNQADIAL
jgi:hypothetical protein